MLQQNSYQIQNLNKTNHLLANVLIPLIFLQAFVYISTAYCNAVVRGITTEEIYPSWIDSDELSERLKKMSDAEIEENTKSLLGGYPTTYSFTKHMAENVLHKKRQSIPVAVVRPSVSKFMYDFFVCNFKVGFCVLHLRQKP